MKLLGAALSWIDTGARSGEWNMEWDVQRAMALRAGTAAPCVRVYGWDPWCISLGRNQSLQEIDLDRAYADGIDVVHRPTGGRAILHAEELTYSVIIPSDGRGIMEMYRFIGEALVAGLQLLAPGVTMAKSDPDFPRLYREAGGIPCFSSSARYEIEQRGRKLVGSAQRRFAASAEGETDVLLQHGSVLIGPAHLALTDYLALDDLSRAALSADLAAHTATLEELTGSRPSFRSVAEALRRGFAEAWNVEWEEVPAASEPVHFLQDAG